MDKPALFLFDADEAGQVYLRGGDETAFTLP